MKFISVVIIILIILILYIILFVKKNDKYKNYPIHYFTNLKNMMGTGDIILFSCRKNDNLRTSIEYYLRTDFVGSEYGHVGLVFRDNNNELYVIECVAKNHCADECAKYLNNYEKGGVRIIKMDTLLYWYTKENAGFFAVKFLRNKISNQIFINNLYKYTEKIFEDKKKLFLLVFFDVCVSTDISKKLVSICEKNRMMCSEFVHRMLYDCGVLKSYTSKLFWPFSITNGELFRNLENIKYSEPYKFIYK